MNIFKKIILAINVILCGVLCADFPVFAETECVMSMHVIDVGQGLSLLFESDGHYLLYDGGDRDYSSKVVSYLKQQNVETLDYVVASHYDSDHLNGIVGALHVFDVQQVIAPDYVADSSLYESFREIIQEKALDVTHPTVGAQISFGNVTATILAPNGSGYENENDYSVALRLECGEQSVVVTGDATALSESEMLDSGQNLDADILIIGHHGSDGSSSAEFLSAVSPDVAVVSCGEKNDYLHPNQAVVECLQAQEIELIRTDKQGDVVAYAGENGWSYSVEPCNDYSAGVGNPVEIPETGENITYVLNKNSKKFHYPSCKSAAKIAEHNYGETTGTRDELIERGFDPCGNCDP